MATEIKLPPLSENVTEGGVLEIRVKAGDAVKAGDVIAVIEAEKSTLEITSDQTGKVSDVLVKKGDVVKVGQPLIRVDAGAATANEKPAKSEKPAKAEKHAEKTAEKPAKQPEAELVEPAEHAQRTAAAVSHSGNGEHGGPRTARGDNRIPAGPATRRLARKLGVDLETVHGSGPRGRVTQDDVILFARRGTITSPAAAAAPPPLPDFAKWGEVEVQPLELVRRKTAEAMSVAWAQVPHVTQHDVADITDLDAFRRSYEGKEPKLTVTAFALKAVAVALNEFPQFNASLDVAGQKLIRKRYVHVGVAVDTDRGLLVPVIREVDKKSVRELATALADIAERSRQRKLGLEEMKGGSFTITNLGGIGGTAFTPIVNWPEVAILGLSRARQEPAVRDGQIVPRLMMPVSLSYDHRVIDGADGARFTRRIAQMLENPLLLLLDA
jgi:pyruvate dehydrogenase E2 component (dihydrolipoamide acetyltransferase)